MKRAMCVTIALLSAVVFAQKPDEDTSRKIDFFRTVPIEGVLTKPVSTYIFVKRKTDFPNLIKIRGSFAPELQKSADNL